MLFTCHLRHSGKLISLVLEVHHYVFELSKYLLSDVSVTWTNRINNIHNIYYLWASFHIKKFISRILHKNERDFLKI